MDLRPASRQDFTRRYGVAVLAALAALLLQSLLQPILGEQNPYHTAWVGLAFSAWYCGVGPAILTGILELLGVWYWFLAPSGSFRLEHRTTAIFGMLGFIVLSSLIITMSESTRRALATSRWAEEQLRLAHDELEHKVLERTVELREANQSLQELSSRLQQARDEERRKISRELHDSVGQLLAALSMNLDVLQAQANQLEPAATRAIADSSEILQEISREVRTISYLLHPPLLDLAGLSSAIRWYADGFSERSQVKIEVEIPEALGRLSDDMEIAIFRMVQECLTNIHRHSGSATARIVIRQEQHRLVVQVEDSGKGIPLSKQLEFAAGGRAGIGFRGMRERLRQLGGELDIRSDASGTVIVATLPRRAEDPLVSQVNSPI